MSTAMSSESDVARFHCYEFLLLRHLQRDRQLLSELRQAVATEDNARGFNVDTAVEALLARNRKRIVSEDLWFLPLAVQSASDRLVAWCRADDSDRAFHPASTHLSTYMTAFNFVEMYLDSVFRTSTDSNNTSNDVHLPLELFSCCPNVKLLSLRSNYLDSLPPDIGRLGQLEKLLLTNNRLNNRSIPHTIVFCKRLRQLYLDDNLLDALPGFLLSMPGLETVHRHGNHNYFKATFFMWYHTDVYERILEAPGHALAPDALENAFEERSLQHLSALAIISAGINFYGLPAIPKRLQDRVSHLCHFINMCGHCGNVIPVTELGYKVFTFKEAYLGNTCVPFLHWSCSLECARAIEGPAREEQLLFAREQDRKYEQYMVDSVLKLRRVNNNSGSGSSGNRGGSGSANNSANAAACLSPAATQEASSSSSASAAPSPSASTRTYSCAIL